MLTSFCTTFWDVQSCIFCVRAGAILHHLTSRGRFVPGYQAGEGILNHLIKSPGVILRQSYTINPLLTAIEPMFSNTQLLNCKLNVYIGVAQCSISEPNLHS